MDKLVERETATRNPLVAAPALAVQFFLIPLAVVGVTVLVYVGFRSLLADERDRRRTTSTEIRTGGTDRQWPAAYELSRLMADPKVRARPRARRRRWSRRSTKPKDGDPRVRRYLALAIGRLEPPLPEAVDALPSRSTIRTLAPDSFNAGRTTDEARISDDLGARLVGRRRGRAAARSRCTRRPTPASGRWWSTRSARCRATRRSPTLRTALEDRRADVRWNAAVALARHGSHEGVPVLRQMLDRAYVEQTVKREVRPGRRHRSRGRRHDQRPARGRGAEGRDACGPRSKG